MISNFDESTESNEYKSSKLQIGDVLKNIDAANYKYLDNLPEHERKQFTPFTVLRWMSSLDDSLLMTYSSSKIESVFGKWKDGGKDALDELKNEFLLNGVEIIGIAKYEHAKYDWRIKFSVPNSTTAKIIEDKLRTEFNITNPSLVRLTDTTFYKQYLIYLNELVNDGFWELQNNPELIYELMCAVSTIFGGNVDAKRTWLPFSKSIKTVDPDILSIFKGTVNQLTSVQLNDIEYKIILSSHDEVSFNEILRGMGYQESERKKLLDKFKKEQKKYVKGE